MISKTLQVSLLLMAAVSVTSCARKPLVAPTKVAAGMPTNQQQCRNELSALQTLDKSSYDLYLSQFNKINKSYEVYIKNKPIISKDASDVMAAEIANKLKVVCSRVNDAVFQNMEKRRQEIIDI
ncbi:hypothetical protein MUA04_11170 [Enterobacteriaceae bacterium H11S18]|uniref:hypothetical protein n=1 Tax=Enterobacteriaceae TaxID=543 RepID=UPI001F315CEA|nr:MULTISPECIES: hypothetical protein [Enterobacteriaceae]MCT4710747.1 hypothetical protein [Dryocola clanedunensis]